MNKKKIRIIALSLTFVLGGALTVAIMKNQTFADETELHSKASESTRLITPEREKVLVRESLTRPAAKVKTKHGEFQYVEVPNEYPSNQVLNLDVDIDGNETPETKQIILRGFVYEKK